MGKGAGVMEGRDIVLLLYPPRRTVLATFTAHGSHTTTGYTASSGCITFGCFTRLKSLVYQGTGLITFKPRAWTRL